MEFKNFSNEDEQPVLVPPPRHFGKTIPLCTNNFGEPRLLLGPQYPLFIVAILVLTTAIGFLLSSISNITTQYWMFVIYFSSVCFLLSYLKIGLSNPGITSKAQQVDEQTKKNQRYCKSCKIIRQPKTIHCQECDVCVIGYDHHCVWIGKCVGRNNQSQYYFLIFLALENIVVILLGVLTTQNKD